jgi:hypothetical protein
MEEFSSKIVKKRSEEANLRYKVEQTQRDLESKGYDQALQKLEKEKQLEEEIAATRGLLSDKQLKIGVGGIGLKLKQLELEATRSSISEKDRELHQQAQINNQNKITLNQLTAQNAMYSGMSGHIAVLAKGITTMGSSLFKNLTNPITQATFIVTQLVDAFKTIDSGAGKLAKGMNISYGEALKVREQFAEIAKNSDSTFVTTEKLSESYLAISQALGANVKISEKDLDTFTKLREQAGFTNEELVGINKISMATGKSVDDTVAGFMGAGKALAIQKGLSINIKQLMKETANVSNAIKLSLGATPEALAKAAIKVKELGISLQQADSIANSLLQFESSITAELEAELLTGKEINLENARYYALMGDIGAMAEEINKEIGGSAEFTKMNRIQQEAYAKAVGMSREELANSLVEQEALNKLGRSLTEEEKNAYEFAKQKYGEEKAAKMLGEDQLDTMMDQASVQERFTAAVEKLKDVFVSIVDGPLGSMLSGLATLLSNATALKTIFGAIAGIIAGRMVLGLTMMIPKMVTALALATGRAAAEVTAAEAITFGLATIGILAGLGAVMGALSSYGASDTSGSSTQYVKDGMIDPSKGLVISKPEGSIGGKVQLKHLAQGIPGDNAYLTTNDLISNATPSSVPQTAFSQSITATPSLGMPSSTEESQQLNTSISKLTETSQLQIEELKKINQENKTINNARLDKMSSTNNLNAVNALNKTTATDLTKSTLASTNASSLKSTETKSDQAIVASTNLIKSTIEIVNKLSSSILGTEKISKQNVSDVTNLSKTTSNLTTDATKLVDSTNTVNNKLTNTSNLNATNALNKTNLTSILDTVDKTQLIKDVINLETQKIKTNENYLNTTNLFQPTPLNNAPEAKLVNAPSTTSTTTANNNEVSTVVNNTVTESNAATTKKLDQVVEVLTQILNKNSNIYLDGRTMATIQNIGAART